MKELEKCPYCNGKAVLHSFIYKVVELPEPIPLFGRWSLLKMRHREIPVNYIAECEDFCDGFCETDIFAVGGTKEEAIEKWNNEVVSRK